MEPSAPAALVRLLLEAGADPNSVDSKGETAIFGVRWEESAGPLEALLAAGADPNHKNREGLTALAEGASPHATKVLAAAGGVCRADYKGTKEQQLRQAAQIGDSKKVTELLRARANPNGKGPYGETALRAAVIAGHLAVAKKLVAAGAKRDKSLFLDVCYKGSRDLLAWLIDERCVDNLESRRVVNATEENPDLAPLLFERAQLSPPLVQRLAEIAASQGQLQNLKLALGAGATIEGTSKKRSTPQ